MEVHTFTEEELKEWFKKSSHELNEYIELLRDEALKGKTEEEQKIVENYYQNARRYAKDLHSIGMPNSRSNNEQ